MRLVAVAVLSLLVAGCVEPKEADLTGAVAGIDAAAGRLQVNTGVFCIAVVAPCYNYSVRVSGKIFRNIGGRYTSIDLADVAIGSTVLAWGNVSATDQYPTEFQATRVVVGPPPQESLDRRVRR